MHEDEGKIVIGSTNLKPPSSIPLNEEFTFLGYN